MRHILVEKHSKALEILDILNSGLHMCIPCEVSQYSLVIQKFNHSLLRESSLLYRFIQYKFENPVQFLRIIVTIHWSQVP